MSLPSELATPLFSQIWRLREHQRRIVEVARLPTMPSKQQFEDQIQPAGYPVIWRDPTLEKCSEAEVLGRLVQSAGNEVLKARRATYDRAADYVHAREYCEVSVEEYVRRLREETSRKDASAARPNKAQYVGNQQLPPQVAASLGVRGPGCLDTAQLEPPAFWLGPADSITPLHKDSTDNFAFQVLGAKRWQLFPVRDVGMLSMTRPDQAASSDFATSGFDIDTQAAGIPVRPIEATVRRGEVLYLPAGWSHAVRNLSVSLMVNYWISKAAFGEMVCSRSFVDKVRELTLASDDI